MARHYDAPRAPPEEHPQFRKAAFAAFLQLAALTGESRTSLRRWLAAEIGIEERYCVIADMDAVECSTVVEICNERAASIANRRIKRSAKDAR